ncbi:MAG: M36 family metallopeptidase [Gaiellaceae bacterium]|jgi:extracellular elastinolytic metalloproteinase
MFDHTRPRKRALWFSIATFAVLMLTALALPAAGRAIVNIEGLTPEALPDFDSRVSVAPSADQLAAASALGADVSWNRFGVASSVSNSGNYVTRGLQAPDAVSAARQWLAANKTLFGLDSVNSLAVATSEPFVGTTNDYAVVFKQVADGVASTDGVATVALVGSKADGWNVTYASSSLTGGSTDATGDVELGPAEAWTQAANEVGVDASVLDIAAQSTKAGTTTLTVQGISQAQHVKKAVFATPHHGARAAYEANVTTNAGGDLQSYQVVVDAQTGDVLYRQSQVDYFSDNPTWLAPRNGMAYNNLNAFPWNYPTTDIREVHCWTATAGCTVAVGDNPATTAYPFGVASKQPWDVQATVAGFTGTANTTWGNNVDDARVWSNALDPHGAANYGNPALTRATSATRDYQPAFTDAWYTSGCNPNNVNAAINPLGNDIEASTVSLFVGHNVMHDWAYYLGFDEGHWNAQQYNNGVTTNDTTPTPGGPTIAAPLANDGLLGNAQSGAATGSRDNANMNTGADGLHPTTNQFVWQPLAGAFYAPCVDGAYDFGVFGHEFGHLIENRMIGKGVGARQGTHAGSMGEAFGDFDALAAFNELHLPIPAGSDRYTEGAYATGNGYNGIRDFLAGRPMGGEFPEPGKNPDTDPLNYGNFGFDIVGTEVHADGEIWVAIQMDLRDLFLARNPSPGAATDIACAHGQINPTGCPGDRQWIQDYYDAMVLMPRNTTMIQARDAMLAADLARFGGANQDLLWEGFALRGFGLHQSTVSNADANPVPDFSTPPATGPGNSVQLPSNATLNFFADAGDGNGAVPVNAKIFVGDYEARSTQIADTNAATIATGTDATGNLDNTAQFVPTAPGSNSMLPNGSLRARWSNYNFVAVAPGYGHLRFRVQDLKAGEVRDITLHMPTNYASAAQGATVTTDAPATGTSVTPGNLIDDAEATSNTQSCTPTATCLVPVNGRWVVIKLGANAPVKVDRLGVSAMFSSRFVGLRSFDAYSCNQGTSSANPTCDGSIDAGWAKIITGRPDSFPGVNPRPGTQDESLRYFNAKPLSQAATHVKFVVTNNQCTGQPSYQGDQDLDPNNNAECRTGIRRSEVHTAEVEVFATRPTIDGTQVWAN